MLKLATVALVFWGGFAVMVLEIIGVRYLAKDFGGSFYVWVSQIGVILVALAIGYSTTRYGSSLSAHLTTREFFTIANAHLGTNGVLAYNVIGQFQGYRATVVGAIYRTMKQVFPQVYLFPASESENVVLIGTKSNEYFDLARVQAGAVSLMRSGRVTLRTFYIRTANFIAQPPPAADQSPVLTDDYAPIESLLQGSQ